MFNNLLNENLFLIILGFIWIIGAILQDLKRREVDNLWNFSLIAFAFAYRLIVSIFNNDYLFLIYGIFGFIIFWILGNLFYYSKLFAGGDVKLLIALGVILPLSYDWLINLKILGVFVLLFLILGSIWSLFYSFYLVFLNYKNFKKEFIKKIKVHKNLFWVSFFFIIIWIGFVLIIQEISLILISLVILLFPFLFVFARSVEESCMIKSVLPKEVTEGDWLYKDIVIGGKKIRSNWEGISEKELKLIQKKCKKRILIKYGIPFTPSFLLGFLGVLFLIWKYNWFI